MDAATRALEQVRDGDAVGLGTGRAATAFVRALAQRVKEGLRVRGVATSRATEAVAREVGIPLIELDEVDALDVTVDGADEVDPQLDLIKGYGGALVREKIVAASSRRLLILVGPEKLVPALGSRGRLPVEVLPFGLPLCRRRLSALGLSAERRRGSDRAAASDNGNAILDCKVSALPEPAALDRAIRDIPGVVDTGLFLGLADVVIVDHGEGRLEVRERSRLRPGRSPDAGPGLGPGEV